MCTKLVSIISCEEPNTIYVPPKAKVESYCTTYTVTFPDRIAALLRLSQGSMDNLVINKKKVISVFINRYDDIRQEAFSLLRELIHFNFLERKEYIFFIFCPKELVYLLSQKIGEKVDGKSIPYSKDTILTNNRNSFLIHVFLKRCEPGGVIYSATYQPLFTALASA